MNDINGALPTLPVTPVIRWAGSKRKILSTLADYWDTRYSRYIEPFAGSAALFFRIQPSHAVLGDMNADLIGSYEVIRRRPDDVHDAVTKIERSAEAYYDLRKLDPTKLSPFRRTVRFVYLNRHCFNGIYRTNTLGQFNVPYANKKPGSIPSIENFRQCARLLDRADLRAADFGSVLKTVRKNDFVYLDPPYAVQSRRVFRQYNAREFSELDLKRLKKHLVRIHEKGAYFVLSYADCSEVRIMFQEWPRKHIRVRRHIAGFVSARRLANEVIISNIPL